MPNDVDYLLGESDYDELEHIKHSLVDDCEKCGGSGFKVVKGSKVWSDTEECKCLLKFRRYKRYYKSKIPKNYWKITPSNFDGDQKALKQVKRYIDHINNAHKNGLGFLFHGTNGNGKTSLSCIIAKAALDYRFSALYSTFQQILNLIMSSFNDDEKKDGVRKLLHEVDFLIIDEVGKEHLKKQVGTGTVFGLVEFEELLRYREGTNRPTFIVTNLRMRELESKYGPSITSLFHGVMKEIEVTGVDKRKTSKKKDWEKLLEEGD